MPTSLQTLSLFVVAAGKHLVSATRGRARELPCELACRLEPLDLALTGRRDDAEAILAERVDVDRADAPERPRRVGLPRLPAREARGSRS
jgi:hypothetical protein